jgi:hypothetical protein
MKVKDENGMGDIGTVKDVEPDDVLIQYDNPSVCDGGIASLSAAELAVLENMHGQRDERVLHEGSPVIHEKFILSQWCYPGPYEIKGNPTVDDKTRPLNDNVVL